MHGQRWQLLLCRRAAGAREPPPPLQIRASIIIGCTALSVSGFFYTSALIDYQSASGGTDTEAKLGEFTLHRLGGGSHAGSSAVAAANYEPEGLHTLVAAGWAVGAAQTGPRGFALQLATLALPPLTRWEAPRRQAAAQVGGCHVAGAAVGCPARRCCQGCHGLDPSGRGLVR